MKSVIFATGLSAILLLLIMGAFPGCGDKEQPEGKPASASKENVKKETKEAYEATKAYTQEQMQAFRNQMETKLDEYGEKINQLQAKTEDLKGDAKTKAEQQVTALRQKRDEVSDKLKELSSSSGNAWDRMKSGMDAAMDDLVNTYKKVAAEFSKS